ncbi:alpha/beta hydrolase, partial [Acinetobacter baumannii]
AISSHWQDVAHLIEQLKLDKFILMGYSMGATTAMHGMKHAHLAQQLKAYLHIDQTPKISVDATWQYGLFGPLHAQFKQLLNDIYQLLSIHKNAKYLYELSLPDRQKLVRL